MLLINLKRLVLLIFVILGSGCQESAKTILEKAKNNIEISNFQKAVDGLEFLVARFPESKESIEGAFEAAKICKVETKDYPKAISFLKHIILYSKSVEDRINAQKQLINILIEQMSDYKNAVIEINKLIVQLKNKSEIADYKMKLAKTYFYLNDFNQAANEVDEFLLQKDLDPKKQFDLLVLKGSIFLAKKDMASAAQVFLKVLKEFPDFSKAENVALTLAVCYEELKDFKNAIAVLNNLKTYHPTPEYIESKIQKLMEKQKNAPGAKGMRK